MQAERERQAPRNRGDLEKGIEGDTKPERNRDRKRESIRKSETQKDRNLETETKGKGKWETDTERKGEGEGRELRWRKTEREIDAGEVKRDILLTERHSVGPQEGEVLVM